MRHTIEFFGSCAWAYQQAVVCGNAAGHSLALGLLVLFFCMLTNHLVAAWLRTR